MPHPKVPRDKAAGCVAREAKKRKSLDGWREHGTAEHAAKACGAGRTTVLGWFRNDAEYRQRVNEAIDEFAATAGQETHNALLEHVRAAARGDLVTTKEGTEGGKPVELRERVSVNPAIARLLLTRADPRFTHPKQEVEHSGSVSMGEALAGIRARMADDGGAHGDGDAAGEGADGPSSGSGKTSRGEEGQGDG